MIHLSISPVVFLRTVLPEQPAEVLDALQQALSVAEGDRRDAVAKVVADHPEFLDGWAQLSLLSRDDVEAYAYARVGYHRGLDSLRKAGWRGSGYVRWRNETNRGFLLALDSLRHQAGVIGESVESDRCALFPSPARSRLAGSGLVEQKRRLGASVLVVSAPSDEKVTELARELARLSSTKSRVFRMSWWNEHLLEWSMARPEFKAELFRLVDVFPATTTSADVMRHVEEYLGGAATPSPLRSAIAVASRLPFGARVTASQARRNIARMADQFILGTSVSEAVAGAKALWDNGSATTIDLLGEKTVAESEADIYGNRVLELLQALTQASATWAKNDRLDHDDLGGIPRASVSVKPTALGPRYHPLSAEEGLRQVKERLRPVLRHARDAGALIWFDMEHYEVKELTIRLFTELLEENEFIDLAAGIVMQAYLKDTHNDIAHLISWSAKRSKPVFIRLVKGAYWDTETIGAHAHDWPVPVFGEKVESDANYERCARLLLDHHGEIRGAFASHNLRSLAYVISYAREHGIADDGIEVQMLYGMAEPVHEAVRKLGLRLRVYAPVGELVPGMSYLVRRLLENTSNNSFVRLRFAEDKALDELVAAPHVDSIPDAEHAAVRPATNPEAPSSYEPEPPAEWHRGHVLERMVKQVTAQASQARPEHVPARINGSTVRTDETIDSVDPSHPDVVVAMAASCTQEHVDAAVAAAKKAWPGWAATPVRDRAAVLFKAATWLRDRRFEIAALEVREAGKPWADADGDVCEAIDFCEYYGREMVRIGAGGVVQSPPGEANSLTYQPRGIGVVIAPWNFPLAIPTGMTVASLVTGNATILKPAEQTPAIASRLVQALEAAGLPDGVLQFLPGRGDVVGASLVADPDVSFIVFTGSRDVGLSIIQAAAVPHPGQRHIKKVIAELGGKNPMIVDTDADLDQAVPAITHSAFGFAGQKCSALSRLIVVESVHDQLLDRLVGAVEGLGVGDPCDMAVDVGPVIDEDAHRRISETVEGAFMWGDVALARRDIPEDGYFVGPTIVKHVKSDSPLARDEIFGPVLSTFAVKNIDEAIALANDSEYALTAGIFSRTPSVIRRLSHELRAGNIYINRQITGAVVGRQPFGGFGMSGIGSKAGGPDYLLQFLEPKAVTENTIRQGFAELS